MRRKFSKFSGEESLLSMASLFRAVNGMAKNHLEMAIVTPLCRIAVS
jgi:hypothetical protein